MRVPRAVIALLCTTLQLCFGTVYAWSFFQTMLVRQVGWTFSQTAWAFSITIFTLGVSAAWAGQVLPRLGPRKLALIGSILFSAGYLIAAVALRLDMLPLFYVGYGVVGGAGIGLGYVTPVATVAKWFPDHKGLVTGIVVMGFGVGAFLLSKGLAPLLVVRTGEDLSQVFLWLGIIFACLLIPCSLLLSDPPVPSDLVKAVAGPAAETASAEDDTAVKTYLGSQQFVFMWIVFFFNIAAGITVISFQSELLQEVWGLSDPSLEPATLAEYGATLIAISSLCNGVGRLFWGLLSDRIGRVRVFRILLASQMVVFGVLMTETNPWIFSTLVCYVLLCFGGGFATMPPFVLDVFGSRKMSSIYGAVLTAWAAAGIVGPVYLGYLKDVYPDRAVMYCFLVGILMLGGGFLFSYLLTDDRMRLGRPTLEGTLREFGIPVSGRG
ncbi:MAG: OFA family MFS transporter [Acidobacteriota bacterium]|nr:OFA family MFS transporter [Acidobacteriota bacterium]MDE2922837.1 OFA family MFS transporter [Acidobacteriota bacterium]MDE3263393.1 OFA family MFS transporter [Acidobacteriota bacterium]